MNTQGKKSWTLLKKSNGTQFKYKKITWDKVYLHINTVQTSVIMIINNDKNKKSSLGKSVETDASVDLQVKHLTCTALHSQNHTSVLNATFSYSPAQTDANKGCQMFVHRGITKLCPANIHAEHPFTFFWIIHDLSSLPIRGQNTLHEKTLKYKKQ